MTRKSLIRWPEVLRVDRTLVVLGLLNLLIEPPLMLWFVAKTSGPPLKPLIPPFDHLYKAVQSVGWL